MNLNYKERERLSTISSIVSIIANALLAILKIGIGFFTNSMAILADGLDTATDILTSVMTLIAGKISNKPPDIEHPYGHERAETIATKIVSLIIMYAGIEVFTNSIKRLINHDANIDNLLFVVIISAISVVVKYSLYKYRLYIGKKINSNATIADALNMRNDVFTSSSVLIGILVLYFTGLWWIDSVLAIFVSLMILKTGFEQFMESSSELMESSPELKELYELVANCSCKTAKAQNPHKIRARKFGHRYFVDMHIELPPEMTVKEANEICAELEKRIKEKNPAIKDIIIHVEPYGNAEKECFGLSIDNIKHMKGE
ncbi:cation transporter [Marinitoga sp. 1135]|uniref:Cation diffusion facilitator family transporter n=1 Tax=Marinitoga piezophila (strain DSM 14283 / JCM 11233 / KA3) TaxID=443254 RepID=H2J3F5_MARPK|nr:MULTISPECIES: cation diffusion facilitator family transporter [Marinitoga]AEX85771.1 cation diffusion facilitator family transporter [Marinitoga piezophila KA3]NUU95972.1 cation transporter [Marinitoga sp. 1135]NUU97884.1 cation transporter [Marinitoga sp. 1138]